MTLFRFKQFGIEQNLSAMKVGTDGVLLGAWSGKHLQSNKKNSDQKFLDIGTGTGLITLMLAQRFENAVIDAIEIDENAVKQAEINIKNSPWSNRIQIYKSSLQDFICNPPSHYDLIVCNPPYFSNGWKVSDKQRELARHTKHLPQALLIYAAQKLLKPEGILALIMPMKKAELMIDECNCADLFCLRKTLIYFTDGAVPKRLLIEFAKFDGETITEELVLAYENNQGYTAQYKELTNEFYLWL